MAPEQFQGRPRLASDQYALGVVVYEWLCGERPFQGTFSELYSQHLFVAPPPLREKVPAIKFEVEQVVLTALEKDPHQRFPSVLAFATALEQACQAYPNTVTMPPKAPFVSPSSKREPIPSCETPWSSKHLISRRNVLMGLAGLTIAGSGLVWLIRTLRIPSSSPHPTSHFLLLGTTILTYRGHFIGVNSVTWSPDSEYIASASDDMSVQVWNSVSGVTYLFYRNQKEEAAVAWSPIGRRIASGSWDKTVQVWDPFTGGHVLTYRNHQEVVFSVAWSPDGKRLASGGRDFTVQVWDTTDGSNAFAYQGHSNAIWVIAWSPYGTRIASASLDNTVQIWDGASGEHIFTYRGHSMVMNALAWSLDGQRIASGGQDKIVQVWQAV